MNPLNPIKARLIKEAIIKAMGIPLKLSGTSINSRRSLMPDISINARKKPIQEKNACEVENTKLPLMGFPLGKKLSTFKIVTPNTAQLVVIKGRYMPKLL